MFDLSPFFSPPYGRFGNVTPEENTDQPLDQPAESREDGTRGRSRLTWLVAALTILVIAAALIWFLTRDGEEEGTDHDGINGGDATAVDPTVTRLELKAAPVPAGRCADPRANPALLGAAQVAFDGTVTEIKGRQVTLAPIEFFAGEATDQVIVAQVGRSLQDLVGAVEFEEGERYLVAATDGRVMLCGFSAEYNGKLAALYELAFD